MKVYSGTSNKGPSEKGTTSLQATLPIYPKVYMQYVLTSEKRTASLVPTRDKMACPKVSFTQRFHCIPMSNIIIVNIIIDTTDNVVERTINEMESAGFDCWRTQVGSRGVALHYCN